MARLGIENASHHTLRHTGASVMLSGGVSVRAVQEIGGWASLRMLERYTHPTDAEKRRAVEISSRITRVGTKTGTPPIVTPAPDLDKALKLLKQLGLKWCPQGEPHFCGRPKYGGQRAARRDGGRVPPWFPHRPTVR